MDGGPSQDQDLTLLLRESLESEKGAHETWRRIGYGEGVIDTLVGGGLVVGLLAIITFIFG